MRCTYLKFDFVGRARRLKRVLYQLRILWYENEGLVELYREKIGIQQEDERIL